MLASWVLRPASTRFLDYCLFRRISLLKKNITRPSIINIILLGDVVGNFCHHDAAVAGQKFDAYVTASVYFHTLPQPQRVEAL